MGAPINGWQPASSRVATKNSDRSEEIAAFIVLAMQLIAVKALIGIYEEAIQAQPGIDEVQAHDSRAYIDSKRHHGAKSSLTVGTKLGVRVSISGLCW